MLLMVQEEPSKVTPPIHLFMEARTKIGRGWKDKKLEECLVCGHWYDDVKGIWRIKSSPTLECTNCGFPDLGRRKETQSDCGSGQESPARLLQSASQLERSAAALLNSHPHLSLHSGPRYDFWSSLNLIYKRESKAVGATWGQDPARFIEERPSTIGR